MTDISTFAWIDHESIGSPTSHITTLELYRDTVARPSLNVLSEKIDELQRSDEASADFELLDYEPLFQSTVEGYLLAVQSIWERGLRGMLIARAKRLCLGDTHISSLQRASWSGGKQADLHHYFRELMCLPLQSFNTYSDLDLLQVFGNAVRHGDGPAAQKLRERCPSLWWNWLAPNTHIAAGPFSITVSANTPKHPNFADITLAEAVLEQMMQSVIWFWEDIEYIRCNSFKRKHTTVLEKLDHWRLERLDRQGKRVWNPG